MRRTPGAVPVPWVGLGAVVGFAVATWGVFQQWVAGTVPDALGDNALMEVLEGVGVAPGESVSWDGHTIPGVGETALALALGGLVVVLGAMVFRRPTVFLALSGAAGAVAGLTAAALVLLAALEIESIPFSGFVPDDIKAQIPDPDVGPGLWYYLAGLVGAALCCSLAAVSTYRHRYGLQWANVGTGSGSPAPLP